MILSLHGDTLQRDTDRTADNKGYMQGKRVCQKSLMPSTGYHIGAPSSMIHPELLSQTGGFERTYVEELIMTPFLD